VSGDVFELLRRCTAEHDWTRPVELPAGLLERLPATAVGAAAADHGVTNLVYLSTRGLEQLDPNLSSLLTTVYHLNLTHHMKVLGELTAIGAALDAAGIRHLAVKGPVLAEVVYPRNDLRAYGDLDLIIPRRQFGDAISTLLDAGCGVVDRNWRVIRREMRGQLHMTARFGTSVDVHWHLVNRVSVRRTFRLDMDELFARGRRVSMDGPEVLTLDAEDTLIQLALHAGLSGGVKLAWLKDIERAAAAPGLDWSQVLSRAHRFGVAEVVAVSLRRTRQLLDAPIPEAVIRELGGSRLWQGIVRGSERLSPAGRPPNQPSLARAVTRATRSSLGASMWSLVTRFGDDVTSQGAHLLGRHRTILAAGGDERDRMAYFDAIQSDRRAA
jgi:hypothetical protein